MELKESVLEKDVSTNNESFSEEIKMKDEFLMHSGPVISKDKINYCKSLNRDRIIKTKSNKEE